MKYYIYPDGTIADELLDFMSDDFYVLQADSYEDFYKTIAPLNPQEWMVVHKDRKEFN